jgi:hypothetical protein
MLAPRLPHPRARSPWTARTAVHASAITDAATARAGLTLALAARGLVEIINVLGYPWSRLVGTLLAALLAVGFVVAARRSHEHRGGWLLSGAIAIGLTAAISYHLVITAFVAVTG